MDISTKFFGGADYCLGLAVDWIMALGRETSESGRTIALGLEREGHGRTLGAEQW